ncbi:hypothetical protein QJS26_gp02 [Serratia phage vB_SmaS_Stoker]|uniref:Uncharacterized protein n=1 Tax=Serratia phage vB_SmaS_Stoker TaxID=2902692 RepID=A0AC61TQQ1_9CAUD|nr:hypothetical protein QJS26_gp02 [Serratia phage vB_SmaS_Stoker]UGO53749.1 hypothetical protein STOKER_2 [Serratia phage vB_SmaS_Stoker]
MNKFEANNLIKKSDFCIKRHNLDGTTDREISVNGKTIAVINQVGRTSGKVFYVHIQGRNHQIADNLNQAFAMCLEVFIEAMAVKEKAPVDDIAAASDSIRSVVESSMPVGENVVTEEIHRFGNADDGRTHKVFINIICPASDIERFKYAANLYVAMHKNSHVVVKAGNPVFSTIDAKMPGATYLGHQSDLRDAKWSISAIAADHDKGAVILKPGDLVVTKDGDFSIVELVREEDYSYKLDNGNYVYWVYSNGKVIGNDGNDIDWQESKKNW